MRTAILAALIAIAPGSLLAQSASPGAQAPIHVGRVAVTPVIAAEAGLETNVRNSALNPESDTFVSVLLGLQATSNLRRAVLDGGVSLPYMRFTNNPDLGQVGRDARLAFSLPFSRLTLRANAAYQDLKQRVNLEIDTRVRRKQQVFGAGGSWEITPNMAVDLGIERQRQDYHNAAIGGIDLDRVLAEDVDIASGTLRRRVTPLTDVLVVFQNRRDRFSLDPSRNSDSQRVMAGFQSTALINGRATVGYVSFSPAGASAPPFRGLAAQGDLQFQLSTSTTASVQASRDVTFSYQPFAPYYVATSVGASVTHPIFLGIVARASAGYQRSVYRTFIASDALPPRDIGTTYSFGLERLIGRHLSLGGSGTVTSRKASGALPDYTNRRVSVGVNLPF
ncbi:MAG: outer membrane beta-barrel protein [Vicinamibacterales bacterium]